MPLRKPAPQTKFPLKGNHYFLGCDGAQQDDQTFTVRILLSGIASAAEARKAAAWLHDLIAKEMPAAFKTEKPKRARAKKAA
jgi:hypothetical protein